MNGRLELDARLDAIKQNFMEFAPVHGHELVLVQRRIKQICASNDRAIVLRVYDFINLMGNLQHVLHQAQFAQGLNSVKGQCNAGAAVA